jgi:hypothetical protein
MPGYGGLAPAAPVAPAPPTGPVSAVFGPPQAQFATPQQAIDDAFDQMGYQASPLSGIDTAIGAVNSVVGPQQANPMMGIATDTAPTPGITANDAVSQGFSALGYGFGTVGLSGADAPGPPGFAGDPGATANLGGYGYGITGPAEAAAVAAAAAADGDTGDGTQGGSEGGVGSTGEGGIGSY